jgi:exopolysaccharide biosynthesis protein
MSLKRILVVLVMLFCSSSLGEPQSAQPTVPPHVPVTPLQPEPAVPSVPVEPETPPNFISIPFLPTLKQISPQPAKPRPVQIRASNLKNTNSKNSVRFESKTVLGYHVKIIRVNLESPNIRVKAILPKHNKGANFDAMVAGSKAVAMINGGYFNTATFAPAGDLVVNGRYVARGKLRTALAITPDNRAYVWVKPQQPSRSSRLDWSGFETLISSGPYILRRGLVQVAPKGEGYKDPAVWGSAARSAVGLSSERKLFFVSTREKLNLWELSKIMRALKAKEAIALDGGSSVGLAWKGKVLIHPKRKIAFSIAIYQ